MINNPRLGIIGGAGPYASALLYHTLLKKLYDQGKAIFEMLILNYPFTHPPLDGNLHSFDRALAKELQACVDTLLAAKINVAVVVCNTLHAYLHELRGGIRLIHLPRTVCETIASAGARKVLILGTPVTRRDGLYSHPGYLSVFPSEEEQKGIDLAIDHILKGHLLQTDAQILEEIVHKACREEGIDGVVLGCTELPVLNAHYPLKLPCTLFDSIDILANRLTVDDL